MLSTASEQYRRDAHVNRALDKARSLLAADSPATRFVVIEDRGGHLLVHEAEPVQVIALKTS